MEKYLWLMNYAKEKMSKTINAIHVRDVRSVSHVIYIESIVSYRVDKKGNIDGTEIDLINGKCIALMTRLNGLIQLFSEYKSVPKMA